MSLRPSETVQKILISTPAIFRGEMETEELLLTQAWPDTGPTRYSRIEEGPASRSTLVLAFRTDPIEKKPGVMIPDYSPAGILVCSYLSVLYGKRFDPHGLIEGVGSFKMPDWSSNAILVNPSLPFHSNQPRANLQIPLSLAESKSLVPLLLGELNEEFAIAVQASSKFYSQALRTFEFDPETAYLHLITALEILSNNLDFAPEDLLPDDLRSLLTQIEENLPNGEKAAKKIRSRLFQVRRKIAKTIENLVDPQFFDGSDVDQTAALHSIDIKKRVLAAYDLRSKYVHTGITFGSWINRSTEEIQLGKPVLADKELSEIIHRAPTFIGLERIVRYCILRFLASNGFCLYPQLETNPD